MYYARTMHSTSTASVFDDVFRTADAGTASNRANNIGFANKIRVEKSTVPLAQVAELTGSAPEKRRSEARPSSRPLAEWHGQVIRIEDAVFIAELKGTHGTGVAGKLEQAVIPIEEVQPSDLGLLRPGAFFRLCVSYAVAPKGTQRRYTEVVFRRLPAYRREELEAAQRAGRDIARDLQVE